MITNIEDACERLLAQFGVQSVRLSGNLTPLQGGTPYTPANIADIEAAVATWKPLELWKSFQNTAWVRVITSAEVASIELFIVETEQTITVPLEQGVGDLDLTNHIGFTRSIRATNQAVFGYAQLVWSY